MSLKIKDEKRKAIIQKVLEMVTREGEFIAINGTLAKWNQGDWALAAMDNNVCKTKLCVAGAAVAVYDPKAFHVMAVKAGELASDGHFRSINEPDELGNQDLSFSDAATEILGLTYDDSVYLFAGSRTQEQVIGALTNYLEDGDWSRIREPLYSVA